VYDVIVVGGATVDCFVDTGKNLFKPTKDVIKFPFGSKVLLQNVQFYSGGGATNISVGLARMGLKVGCVCKIGKDHNAEMILQDLAKEDVDTNLVVKKEGRTGFAVILDARGHDRTILIFKGSNDLLRFSEIKKRDTQWFYLCTMLGTSFKTLEKLADYAMKKKIRIAFNPSEYLAKRGYDYLDRILHRTEVLILNREEAMLLSKKKDIKEILSTLRGFGAHVCVITNGDKEIHAYDGNHFYQVKPHPTKVVETTGAGDAFGSGFLSAYIKKKDINFALKVGLVNSESVIQHYGAKNKLLRWNELRVK